MAMMKLLMACGLLGSLAIAPAALADEGRRNDEDARLDLFFRSYLETVFRDEPMAATRWGDHRFDDRLDDISKKARDRNLERDRRVLAELPGKVDYRKLSRDRQIDFEIFRHHLERSLWLAENFEPFEDDPRIYGEYLADSVYLPLSLSSLPKEANVKNVRARMVHIPKVVKVARETIGKPPRVKVETAIRQTEGAIGFYEKGLFEMTGEPRRGELAGRADAILAALKEHLAFLKGEVLPRSTAEGWRIGKEKFARKLELELDAGLSADEVLAAADSEASRVEREMATMARALWASMFPKEPVPPDDEPGRREMVRRVLAEIAKDHGTPETLVSDVRATVAEITAFIAEREILRLPDPDRLRILEMPEFKRGNSAAYLESAPPLDPDGASEYAISPPPSDWTPSQVQSYLEEYNRAMLKILTIHEAYPGHYVQLEYSNRCPSLIRRVLASGTFAEGWAVYTEQMMLDSGFGGIDLKLRLQQLKFYLRAVVNAILDHKMHCENMTDEQAKELLMGRAFQSEGEALGKIIRAKQSSAQLSTYFVGRLAFDRLRQAVQRELGGRFRLGRYHEAVLAHGTLPVKYLPELVRKTLGRGD
jgi:uncharacterized protein (DUF885 family)